ncbi:MAG: DNA-directed RNA polymerase subunit omega [Bryobacteraceae bacterium]|jgi:DNA-directed RNA polymerase subunit omega|nr:DNA-directed RNA polymerase subunit omega [Bryobacteraceae bacterium]MCO5350209.1 DNA-directed RNA polymerase subunit omega [Bryobacteraceae bacterium]HAX44935.1 DNA-directed RNA polymerase subunit omega [Bryobacterales bacterium]HRJ17774.1 DNA-directed RNA polymerase subunit omega [Bryobacteraceae bacterium]
MTERILRSPIHAIPDDPEQSVYRFIIVAAKRARQLQGGQRSFLPGATKKPTVAAMEEVRRGLVSYWEVSDAEAGLTPATEDSI